MSAANCPDQKQLLQYLSGSLDRKQSEYLSDHIDTCAICNATISTLNPGADNLVGGLQNVMPSSFTAEPECSDVIQRIAAQSPPLAPPLATVGGSNLTGAELIAEGTMLRDYRLLEQIGRGGMGAVHRAEHVRLKRPVAIKLLLTDRLQDDSAIARFNREMEAVGKLDHPNIVRATDAGDHDGTHFLVMELVDGPNLSQVARTLGPLDVADACELVRQAAEGLQHAYEHGLVHRDIKPSNLLLAGNGTVKILDLGLALLRESPVEQDELTSSGQIMGTLDYMAPEQASDTHGVDIRADLYSLGCTLYHLLAGAPPFRGSQYSTILKKMMAHAQTPVPPLSNVRSDIPSELWAILDQLLAKEPSDRYATPEQVAAALQPFAREARLSELMDEWRNSAEQDQESSASRSTVAPASSAQSDTLDPDSVQPAKSLAAQSAEDADGMAPTIMIEPGPASANSGRSGRQNQRRFRKSLAGFGGILLLGIVFFVGTGEGRVELTVNHRDIQVSVDGEPQQIRVLDGTNGVYRIELPNIPAGRREMIVSRDGFSAETRHFWITRGGTRAFEIQVSPDSLSAQPMDDVNGELQVAKWVLSLGGKIVTNVSGWIDAETELPSKPFRVTKIEIQHAKGVSNADISRLHHCPGLTHLDFGSSSLTDDGLKRLADLNLPLTCLSVHNCRVGDEGVQHLRQMKEMTRLTFTATRITDAGVKVIAENFPKLSMLFVGSTAISDASVPDLAKMTSLKRLQIDRTRISFSGVQRLKAALPDTEIVTDGGSLTPLSEQGPSYALRFQGGADAVTVSDLKIRDSEPFTFEAWILVDSLPRTQHQAISLFKNTGGVGGDNIWVTHEGRLTYRVDRRSSTDEAVRPGGNMSMVSAGPLPMGRWIHVAAVRDGKQARLFVDGELLAHMSIPPGRDVERTGFALGKSWHTDARYGDIQIGWVRISRLPRYGKDFMPGITEKSDGETVALYLFDEGQGEILRDVSGGKHFNGVIDGAKWVRRQLDAAETAELSPNARDQRFAQWVLNHGGELRENGQLIHLPLSEERGFKYTKVTFTGRDFGNEDIRKFVEILPSTVGHLELFLEDTSVTSSCFPDLSKLPQLWQLLMRQCVVDPREIQNLRSQSLRQLHLLDVALSEPGTGKYDWRGLPNLEWLQLGRMNNSPGFGFNDSTLEEIGKTLKRLAHLTLIRTNVTDDGLHGLAPLPGLKRLELQESNVTDAGLATIVDNHPELEALVLNDSLITGKALEGLKSLEHLAMLSLEDCERIDNSALSGLSQLSGLNKLNITATSFSDQQVDILDRLPNLNELVAKHTQLTDRGLEKLAALPSLRSLDIDRCLVTAEGVASVMTKHPTLQVQSHFSDEEILEAMGPEGRDQRFAQWVLDRGGKMLSTDTYTPILVAEEAPGRGANFAVDFSAVSDFGDDDLRTMNSLRPARIINLILRNTAVTDAGLAAIEGFPCYLVGLAGTSVTDRSAAVLATLPRLHILDLSGTRMTGASLAELKLLPELDNLRLEGIPVSDNEFQSLDGCDLRNLVFSNLSTDAERAITDRSMPVVGRMHRMYWLALPDSITDDGIQHLGALTGLKKLKCNGEGVTDRSAGVFASFSELEVLELLDTGVTGETIDALTCEGSLSQLVLNGSVRIAPEAFGRLNRFRELTELYLNNTRITNGQLAALSELPLLKRLN